MALGEIQMVVGVDVRKAAIVPGQAKTLHVTAAVGGRFGGHDIHHPGMGAAQAILPGLQAHRQGNRILVGGLCQHQRVVPDQAGVLQAGAGIGVEHPGLNLHIACVGDMQRAGSCLIPETAKLLLPVATGKQLHLAGLGIACLVLAHPLAQGRHQGIAVSPVPGFDRPQRLYLVAVGAQGGEQGIQGAAGIAAGRCALQGAQVVVEAPGAAVPVDTDGGLGGGHRQAVHQLAKAVMVAEQAGPVVIGGEEHTEALLEPALRRRGQGRFIDKLQIGRQQRR